MTDNEIDDNEINEYDYQAKKIGLIIALVGGIISLTLVVFFLKKELVTLAFFSVCLQPAAIGVNVYKHSN